MVEETQVVNQGEEATDSQGVNAGASPSPEGVKEGQSPSPEAQGASESKTGEKTHEETVPYERFAEANEKAKRVDELEARIAELESGFEDDGTDDSDQSQDAGTTPATSQDPPWLQKILTKYPADQHEAVRTFYEPVMEEMNALKAQIGRMNDMTMSEREKGILQRFPDLKKASRDNQYKMGRAIKMFEQLGSQDAEQDAYDYVFKDKVLTEREKQIIEKHNKLNEEKKNANTMPGVSGTTTAGRPPLPKKDEDWPAYMAWIRKQGNFS